MLGKAATSLVCVVTLAVGSVGLLAAQGRGTGPAGGRGAGPAGGKGTIERITAKLEGKHWMFQNSAQRLAVLKMCEDCRVVAITEQELDPYGAPPRPKACTTEDYLREREEQERAGKPET